MTRKLSNLVGFVAAAFTTWMMCKEAVFFGVIAFCAAFYSVRSFFMWLGGER